MRNIIIFLFITFCGFKSISQNVEHIILVSIDGFRPDFYLEKKWAAPNIKWMAQQGVYAEEVITIFPSVTYPSHTTLSTGVLPKKHGVYYNTKINKDGSPGQWIYDSKEVKSKTIWQAAKEKGMSTASVSWPITLGNKYIDFNLPEIWDFDNRLNRIDPTKKYSTPKGLFDEILENALGNIPIENYNLSSLAMDENLGRAASYILVKYKPNLLTIHLPNTDVAQHEEGRDGIGVERSVAGADRVIGNIYDAIKKAGIADKTIIIITGDHGFVNTYTSISPNSWLKDAGLLDDAFFFSSGGSTALQIKNHNKDIVSKVLKIINALPQRYRNMFEIIDSSKIEERGADPNVFLALSAKQGYYFDNKSEGPAIKSEKKSGKHGYYPNFNEIYTGFVAYGSPLKKNQVISQIYLEDIAVTIAYLLNITLENTDGIVLPVFKK